MNPVALKNPKKEERYESCKQELPGIFPNGKDLISTQRLMVAFQRSLSLAAEEAGGVGATARRSTSSSMDAIAALVSFAFALAAIPRTKSLSPSIRPRIAFPPVRM